MKAARKAMMRTQVGSFVKKDLHSEGMMHRPRHILIIIIF